MINVEGIRGRYVAELPLYERLAGKVAGIVTQKMHDKGIDCHITHRAKSLHSLIKKAMRTGDSYEKLFDKAGVRVIVPYREWVPIVREAVETTFLVSFRDDKAVRYSFKEFDYLGMHYGVSLQGQDLDADNDLGGLNCEVQVQTSAENLWMSVSHDLTYKPDVELPHDLMRSMHRLMAIMEVFDSEVNRIRTGLISEGRFIEYRLLDALERRYFQFVGIPYDRALSYQTLQVLIPLLTPEEISGFEEMMRRFVAQYQGKLVRVYAEHRDEPESELLFQPETLLIFERLEAHKSSLTAAWRHLPIELLEHLSLMWGNPIITEYA